MTVEQENQRLKACLRYLRVLFQYGPGAESPHAPVVCEVIGDVMGGETTVPSPVGWTQLGEFCDLNGVPGVAMTDATEVQWKVQSIAGLHKI